MTSSAPTIPAVPDLVFTDHDRLALAGFFRYGEEEGWSLSRQRSMSGARAWTTKATPSA
jgi:hypothetical protein